MTLKAKDSVLKIHAYVPGGAEIAGFDKVIKLASNENPLGPSPKALAAIADAKDLHLYPDGGSNKLRAAIAAKYGLPKDNIVCGAGSEQLISLLTQAFAGPGDEVLYSQYGFLVYRISALAAGAEPVIAEEIDYHCDVDNLLAAVTDKTRIVYLANPNNPTGTLMVKDEVRRLRAGLRDDILLVIDAAYAEYVDSDAYSAGHDLVAESIEKGKENVAVLHTFSKIYGLPAVRIGWCYGPDSVTGALNRVRGAFNCSTLAQVAGIAALNDDAYVAESKALNDHWLAKVSDELTAVGLYIPKSYGNFVLCRFPDGAEQAAACDSHLKANGVIVRPVAGYGLADCLRITIGTADENTKMLALVKEFMSQ